MKGFTLEGLRQPGFEPQCLFLTSCVTLGKALCLAYLHLPPLEMGMMTYNTVVMINIILRSFFLLQMFSKKRQYFTLYLSPSLRKKEAVNNYLP